LEEPDKPTLIEPIEQYAREDGVEASICEAEEGGYFIIFTVNGKEPSAIDNHYDTLEEARYDALNTDISDLVGFEGIYYDQIL